MIMTENKIDISEKHKGSKREDYWNDLSVGSTTAYKTLKIEELIRNFFPKKCDSILDIGSGGNCDHVLKYRKLLQAKRIACLDYDGKIINQMRQRFPNEGIEWHVADIFELPRFEKGFDLIFLLDMLHEVYSFYGRPNRNMNEPINYEKGLEHVVTAMENISEIVNPRGGIVITDAILPSENTPVTFRTRSHEITDTIDYFFKNYPSRNFGEILRNGNFIAINQQDFSVLLTQYNKIKKKDWGRWNIERLEQHQYMTKEQYEEVFSRLGFKTHMIIETPAYVLKEWKQDFEIVGGATDFPPRRVTLLAVKE